MWVLRHLNATFYFYLKPEKTKYIVGRTSGACDLMLGDDATISRCHATLLVKDEKLFVIDEESKYNVFVNEGISKNEPIKAKEEIQLKKGDRIRFGRKSSEFVLGLVNVSTAVSTLTEDDKSTLAKILGKIGGKVVESVTESCTHMTMKQILVTSKQLQSLVIGLPIVNMQYWIDVVKAVNLHQAFPNFKEYLPDIAEDDLRTCRLLFHVNISRRDVFRGKVFYFFTKRMFNQYKDTILLGGGTAFALDDKQVKIKKSDLTKENAIVIQYESNSQSQASQATQSIDTVSQSIRAKGLRLIPGAEIQFAILHCSLDKYCNPRYTFDKHFAELKKEPSEILVKNTEDQSCDYQTQKPSQNIVIPESVPLSSEKMKNSMTVIPQSTPITIEDSESDDISRLLKVIEPASLKRTTRANARAKNSLENTSKEDSGPALLQRQSKANLRSKRKMDEPLMEETLKNKVHVVQENVTVVGKRSTRSTANRQIEEPSFEVPEVFKEKAKEKENVTPPRNKPSKETEKRAAIDDLAIADISLEEQPKKNPATINSKSNASLASTDSRGTRRRANEDDDADNEFFGDLTSKRQKTDEIIPVSQPLTLIASQSSNRSRRSDRNREINEDDDPFSEQIQPAPTKSVPVESNTTIPIVETEIQPYQKPPQVESRVLSIPITPTLISTEGWLSVANIPHQPIKMEHDDMIKKDPETLEYEKKIEEFFVPTVMPMPIISRHDRTKDTTDAGSNSTTNSSLNSTNARNFKAFVKKFNYKPQSKIVTHKIAIVGEAEIKF
uniref:CSON013831 protein n=1 Tax=Culicoides sonorensis TaxID=179676 RepID=A0A336LN68_CULSO